jgi:thermitase
MANKPENMIHPSFGPCEVNSTLFAIKWRQPMTDGDLRAAVLSSDASLSEPGAKRSEPTEKTAEINNSSTLSWTTTTAVAKSMQTASANPSVEWVSPVYRAVNAEKGDHSLFAINPTVLILTAAADSAVDIASIESSAEVDTGRTHIMKGFVVYKFPKGNAVEISQKLLGMPEIAGLPNAISLENVPYLSPLCGCGCASPKKHQIAKTCQPLTSPHIPNDPLFASQWGLQRIEAPNGWSITKGDPNVVVAVLDQGVDLLHPDLNLWPISYSTISHTNDGSSVGNHGTACAGIIGAKIDNALGLAGLAPECKVMAIATNFADTEVAEGLFFAADNGAKVVSMSFGVYPSWGYWNFAIIEAALQYCYERNVCLIAATGNENQAVSRFPATDPRALGIGGSNRADERHRVGDTSIEPFWGACYGPDVDVVAPCLEIPTTDRLAGAGYTATDYTLRFNGTSSATPHVAALAGLILSLCPKLTPTQVYQIIGETCDKINAGNYTYLATAGKPFSTWHNEVGYGRINVERALLAAQKCCQKHCECSDGGKCSVCTPEPENCCVSPCEPAWLTDENCLVWYEDKFFRVPIRRDNRIVAGSNFKDAPMIEFRLTYEHRMCLLGKQHGPLLFTTTLLPGETVRLYHSDRYRRITSTQQRYSVQTTFMQFLQVVHEARASGSINALSETLTSSKSGSSGGSGGGFFFGLFGFGGGSSSSSSRSVSSRSEIDVHFASEQFNQSVVQSSLLTHAERSVVVSTYEDKETIDVSVRTIHNDNECRAVTYFVRQIMELYSMSTKLSDIKYRIVFPNVPDEWRSINDTDWLPAAIRDFILDELRLLPKIGTIVIRPRPISIPTDGVVYDPELANCCSCEPEKAAAIGIRLEMQKAEAMKACLDVQNLEMELKRREMLLAKGELGPFELVQTIPAPSD